ncbi:ceramide synthase 2 isoform X3 [Manis pentadactyla]|uniref:ceramide synthase 2 isoform X3 n=1 Tax=Manis pentadactyla TaxID=143292 RepID=UPI00255CD94E|nr:ceramide synthase 2 isoform X3 [Manis pentadactyla]
MLQTLYDYFWWERLWLPVNLTWADLEDRDGRVYAKASDLYITLPLALLFLIIRYFFELYVATPLASLLNVKEKTRLRAPPNPTLEHFYLTSGKQPKQVEVELLSRQSGLSGRQVERWFRRRRNQDRPSLLKKFREASWRFTFYLIAFIAGMAVIVDKPWFYDMKKVWEGYPIQSTIPSQYWYYMIELSFYWSLLFSIASDVKRKDFKEQIIHHVATIILISFSWFANYIRAGTLIMALHDSSDYLLEDTALHCGVPTGALSCLLWLLLLQFHDGSATDAAYLLGLPHFAHGPQVHNWKAGRRRTQRPGRNREFRGGRSCSWGRSKESDPCQWPPHPQ